MDYNSEYLKNMAELKNAEKCLILLLSPIFSLLFH